MIVAYDGHGGNQSAAQIKTVLGYIGMRVVEKMVCPSHRSSSVSGFQGEGFSA